MIVSERPVHWDRDELSEGTHSAWQNLRWRDRILSVWSPRTCPWTD